MQDTSTIQIVELKPYPKYERDMEKPYYAEIWEYFLIRFKLSIQFGADWRKREVAV